MRNLERPNHSKKVPSPTIEAPNRLHRSGYFRAMRPCLAALAALAASCASGQDDGPIQTRNSRSFNLLFLRFAPSSGVLEKGKSEASVCWTCANDFRSYFGVLEDQETSRFELSYKRGFSGGWEVQAEAAYLVRSGGFMDPIIDWWHKSVLSVEPPGRSTAPYGQCLVSLPDRTFRSASGLGDTSIRVSKRLAPWAVGTGGLKLPTGNDRGLLGSGAFDAGVSVTAHGSLNAQVTVYGQLAYVWQGRAVAVRGTRSNVAQEALAFVWRRNSRDSWIVQWQGEDAAIRTGNPVSDSQHRILSLGYRRRLAAGRWIELHFSEDGDFLDNNMPAVANVGPDFTIGARYVVRW